MCDVSIIIPVFNGEKYLKKCLNSVCKQTLKNIEIICINDGSTDNSLNILNKYASKDNRIKVISTENNGQGTARNIALNMAKGEYIGFVDADDWVDENTYELLYNNAKNNKLDLVFFQMINYIQNTGDLIETDLYNLNCFKNFSNKTIFNHENTSEYLFEIPVCPVSKLYNKKFLDSNNLRFPEKMLFEDNAFFYNSYFKCEKAGYVKKQLYYRRRHEESVTQKYDESKFDIIKATNEILDVFIQNNKFDYYKIDVINHTFSMIIEWFKKTPLELKQKFFSKIQNEFKGFMELKNDFKNNLNNEYLTIFNLIESNTFYLDFLAQYKLKNTNYWIYDNSEEFKLNSEKYEKYKIQNMKKYKLSVIIPIYNNETLIHRTLMSIENQTIGVEDIEVLMVDDGSNDKTYEIIKKYADKYSGFKAIHIENGTGSPGTPRNIGLIESTTNYVLFLDHDDFLELNALKKLLTTIEKNNLDLVYGTYVSIDDGYPTKIIFPNEHHGFFKEITENERAIAFPPPSIWTKLFKRDFLIENNILFPTILGEDAIFLSKALINANGINYLWDSTICYHDLNKNSYTNNISYKYLLEGFVSEKYLYDFYKRMNYENFYKIRGYGILDFYLTQFYKSNLNKNEILKIFPELYGFINRLKYYGLTPHSSDTNKKLYNYILQKDMDSIFKLKKISNTASIHKSLKTFLKKIFNKFNQI